MTNDKMTVAEALEAALRWIDAVPSDTPLPAMPGFDRDLADKALQDAQRGATSAEEWEECNCRTCPIHPDTDAAPEGPDNPSGMKCDACRTVGLSHCSDPQHCGGMQPMTHAVPQSAPLAALPRDYLRDSMIAAAKAQGFEPNGILQYETGETFNDGGHWNTVVFSTPTGPIRVHQPTDYRSDFEIIRVREVRKIAVSYEAMDISKKTEGKAKC